MTEEVLFDWQQIEELHLIDDDIPIGPSFSKLNRFIEKQTQKYNEASKQPPNAKLLVSEAIDERFFPNNHQKNAKGQIVVLFRYCQYLPYNVYNGKGENQANKKVFGN